MIESKRTAFSFPSSFSLCENLLNNSMLKKLFIHLVLGILAIYLATLLIPGVVIQGSSGQFIEILILAGIVLGLVNYFLKPLIKVISLPLRILTLGLFSLIINILMVWIVDILFPELIILGIWPLVGTGLLSWFLNLFIPKK